MSWLALAAAVHTTGINWTGLVANVVAIGGAVGALIAFTLSRLDKRRAAAERAAAERRAAHEAWVTRTVTTAVEATSAALSGRIEGLAGQIRQVSGHLDDQDQSVDELRRRCYRMETKLMRQRNA